MNIHTTNRMAVQAAKHLGGEVLSTPRAGLFLLRGVSKFGVNEALTIVPHIAPGGFQSILGPTSPNKKTAKQQEAFSRKASAEGKRFRWVGARKGPLHIDIKCIWNSKLQTLAVAVNERFSVWRWFFWEVYTPLYNQYQDHRDQQLRKRLSTR